MNIYISGIDISITLKKRVHTIVTTVQKVCHIPTNLHKINEHLMSVRAPSADQVIPRISKASTNAEGPQPATVG